MVVALDDLPPLLRHAELGRTVPEVWTGERQRGVQLHLLACLPSRRPASWYHPGGFWSGDRIQLAAPFALTVEVAVRDQPPARTAS